MLLIVIILLIEKKINIVNFIIKIDVIFNPFYTISLLLTFVLYRWWKNISKEGDLGHQTIEVQSLLRIRILWFISSEVIFFFGFFWTYIWNAFFKKILWAEIWPPSYNQHGRSLNPYIVPLLNCCILLSSGITVTWAHARFSIKERKNTEIGLLITLILAFSFTIAQGYEYWWMSFNLTCNLFGTIFFSITGMHGMHVIVGSIIIFISYIRLKKGKINNKHHRLIELSIWYWHFVDVVWIFVFIILYWRTFEINNL